MGHLLVGRVGEEHDDPCGGGEDAQEEEVVAVLEQKGEDPDDQAHPDVGQRSVTPQAGKYHRRLPRVEILDRQRFVGSLKEVESHRHDKGGHQQPRIGGKESRKGGADAEEDHRPSRQAVFLHQEEYVKGGEGEEAGDFPDGLGHPDLKAVDAHHLFGIVGVKGRPPLQSGAGADHQDHEIAVHRVTLQLFHSVEIRVPKVAFIPIRSNRADFSYLRLFITNRTLTMREKQKLAEVLGLGYIIIFVVANIIGSGVYKKIAPMAAELPSPLWILLAWLAGGLITLMGALSNAEVAGLLAGTGGDFVYLRKIYNRFFSFLYGWSLFTVIQTATISSLAYVFTQSLHNLLPIPEVLPSLADFSLGGIFYPFRDSGIKLVSIGLIMGLSFLNISGLKSGALTSKVILFLVAAGLSGIVISGLASHPVPSGEIFNPGQLRGGTVTVPAFFTAMLAAFWAYQGWVSVGYIGGELKNARRNIPRGIVTGVFIVIAVYLLVNYTYLSLLTIPELQAVNVAGNRIAAVEAVRTFGGHTGVILISVLILVTTLGCTNASILTGARPYYAMAREGLFPRAIGHLNKAGVPGNSLLWQGIWASVLVLTGTFDQLTDMIIFAVFIFYGATTLGVFILRRRMPDAHRPYKVWGYPVVPALYILFCIGLVVNTLVTRPREAAIGIVLILAGIPFYFLMKRSATP